MLFNSWEFAIFFVVVFTVYYRLDLKRQNCFLLAASYFFLGWWDWRFLSLLLLSTGVDYLVACPLTEVKVFNNGTDVHIPDRYFYDYGHLTRQGGRIMTEQFADLLRQRYGPLLEKMGRQTQ